MTQLTTTPWCVRTRPTLTIHFPSSVCLDNFIGRIDNAFDHSVWGEDDVLCNEYEKVRILFSLGKSRSLFRDEKSNLKSNHKPQGMQELMTKGDLFQHRMNDAGPHFRGRVIQLDLNYLSEAEKELLGKEGEV